MVSTAFALLPKMAVTDPLVLTVTGVELILNCVELAPAGTVTVDGKTAAGFVVVIATTTPPSGATPLRAIAPVALLPPLIVAGETVK